MIGLKVLIVYQMNLKKLKQYKIKYYNKGYNEAAVFYIKEIKKTNVSNKKSIQAISKTTESKNKLLDDKIKELTKTEREYFKKLHKLKWIFSYLRIEDHKIFKIKDSLLHKASALRDKSIRFDEIHKAFEREFGK